MPLLIFVGAGFLLIPSNQDLIREVCNFTLNTSFCIGLTFLIPRTTARKYLLIISLIILNFLAFVKLSFYEIFGAKLSASAIFVIFETNQEESLSFFKEFINFKIIGLGLILLVILFYLIFLIQNRKAPSSSVTLKLQIKILTSLFSLIILIISSFLIQWKFSDYNLIFQFDKSYHEYIATKKLISQTLSKNRSKVFQNSSLKTNSPEIVVIIIGESTTRTHLQLYGYNRETTPKLNSIKNNLLIFNDVISPHVHTIESLNEILTLASSEQETLEDNASIVQLANSAGYETYWLSNQRPVGLFESIPTLIGYAADQKIFKNTDDYNRISYDEVLLPELNKILKNSSKKKMIFMHLSGTHVGYSERYPENFNYFSGEPITKYNSKKAFAKINEYDNAVRYNDSIIYEIIQSTNKLNSSSAVIYFSDHGDDVFEEQEKVGHSKYVATNPMYEVPFIVWFSKEYKTNTGFEFNKSYEDRSYMLDNFVHTFSNIAGIKFSRYIENKDLLSKNYIPEPRIIKESEVYEK